MCGQSGIKNSLSHLKFMCNMVITEKVSVGYSAKSVGTNLFNPSATNWPCTLPKSTPILFLT